MLLLLLVACDQSVPLGDRAGDDTAAPGCVPAGEVCNGADDDCDGLVDSLDPDVTGAATWYADTDGDGFGDVATSAVACEPPPAHVADATDCDDADATVHPAAPEACDGADDDCDGLVDGQDPDVTGAATWYADADGDGYGDVAASEVACEAPVSHVADATDCDDADATLHPAALEVCDGADDDCDGLVDGQDPGVVGASTWYTDADGDGYGDPDTAIVACNAPRGTVGNGVDPDDTDPNVIRVGCAAIDPSPAPWSMAPASGDLVVTFDTDMDAATIDTTSFVVQGEISGFLDGTVWYDSSTRAATFSPISAAQPGERVTAVLTGTVACATGSALAPRVWTFTTEVDAGTGDFARSESPVSGTYTYNVNVGDLDRDGDLEIVAVELGDDVLTVFDDVGGGFVIEETIATGEYPMFAEVADVDGDGDLDLISVATNADEIWIHANDGTGAFTTAQRIPTSNEPRSVQAGDLDGDGDLDLVADAWDASVVEVLLNDGTGSFTLVQTIALSAYGGHLLQLGDLDGDYDLDVIAPAREGDVLDVFLNDGTGVLREGGSYAIGDAPFMAYVNDLDGDGTADVAVGLQWGSAVSVALGDGTGELDYLDQTATCGVVPSTYGGDVDADGDIDLAAPCWDAAQIRIFLNDGAADFRTAFTASLPDRGAGAVLADMDGDGALDLVVATADFASAGNLVVYLNEP